MTCSKIFRIKYIKIFNICTDSLEHRSLYNSRHFNIFYTFSLFVSQAARCARPARAVFGFSLHQHRRKINQRQHTGRTARTELNRQNARRQARTRRRRQNSPRRRTTTPRPAPAAAKWRNAATNAANETPKTNHAPQHGGARPALPCPALPCPALSLLRSAKNQKNLCYKQEKKLRFFL